MTDVSNKWRDEMHSAISNEDTWQDVLLSVVDGEWSEGSCCFYLASPLIGITLVSIINLDGYAIGSVEVDEKITQPKAIFQQFLHRRRQKL